MRRPSRAALLLLLLAGAAREGLAPVARPDCADDPFTARRTAELDALPGEHSIS